MWVLALLLVIAVAGASVARSLIASSENNAAEIQQVNRQFFVPYNMVEVALAKAENAVAMPDAGQDDAIVVAVVRDGAVFLGQNKVDPAQLGSFLRDKLVGNAGKTIYLRADARAEYRDVENAVAAMRSAGAEEVGLVTRRKEDAQPGNRLWMGNPLIKSVGLEVSIASAPETPARGANSQDRAVVVRVIYHPNAAPAYKIGVADVARAELQSRLKENLANRAERVMFVEGDGDLRFSDIVDVIDLGMAANADHVGLIAPGGDGGKQGRIER